ncbi:MAG: SDR family NAD(P)-dependent oxidoreductase [Verrucomicrobiales bacterium]|jgi:NAD(P)-dependent dehydrogenase (short-subunit alcohol dehydrogenase family)|nr:SDR family NAD(P)-dependent oxidoreductase [Verrucomicrobiales bacterium]
MSKLIVITGVTRGLGRALTEHLINSGHTIIGCARNTAAIDELGGRFGAPHLFQTVDVADDDAVKNFARHALESYGAPDLLVNNAALINQPKPLWTISAAEFDALVGVNISGNANLIRHFVPAMIARKRGVIVNFSSAWGRNRTDANLAPYCASKWAVEGLTQALAQELPAGMAAVTLNPTDTDTDMLRTCWPADANAFPIPAEWVLSAAPFILKLSAKDNGKSLTVG